MAIPTDSLRPVLHPPLAEPFLREVATPDSLLAQDDVTEAQIPATPRCCRSWAKAS
jgi:hypothetical protein